MPRAPVVRWVRSPVLQAHGLADLGHCLTRGLPRALATCANDATHELGVLLVFAGTLANGREILQHRLDERFLAVQATDARRTTTSLDPGLRLFVRIDLVQVPDRALVRVARIGAPDSRRIGLHGLELFLDAVRVLPQAYGVAVGLRHLPAVEPRYLRRPGK